MKDVGNPHLGSLLIVFVDISEFQEFHTRTHMLRQPLMIESSVGLGALWTALSKAGTGHHAGVILRLNISGPNDLAARSSELIAQGVKQQEIEMILAELTPPTPRAVAGRRDHPTLMIYSGKASLTLALAAAQPNHWKL